MNGQMNISVNDSKNQWTDKQMTDEDRKMALCNHHYTDMCMIVYMCVCVCMNEEEFKGLMGIIGTQRATLALREGLVTK